MKQTKIIMGMPITLEVLDRSVLKKDLKKVFDYFKYIDNKFSPFKLTSEVSRINRGEIFEKDFSSEMKEVLKLSEKTRKQTQGYFNVYNNGILDPCGIVKGWAIQNAARILIKKDFKNFYIDAGGDILATSKNKKNKFWKLGIRNPFKADEVIKILEVMNKGIATSGTYIRGDHIYNPNNPNQKISEIVSITVVGQNIFDADRFATAAFAMGRKGIYFIESLPGLEAYMVDKNGNATYTSGFNSFVKN